MCREALAQIDHRIGGALRIYALARRVSASSNGEVLGHIEAHDAREPVVVDVQHHSIAARDRSVVLTRKQFLGKVWPFVWGERFFTGDSNGARRSQLTERERYGLARVPAANHHNGSRIDSH
jgi:hypothetical protein